MRTLGAAGAGGIKLATTRTMAPTGPILLTFRGDFCEGACDDRGVGVQPPPAGVVRTYVLG